MSKEQSMEPKVSVRVDKRRPHMRPKVTSYVEVDRLRAIAPKVKLRINKLEEHPPAEVVSVVKKSPTVVSFP